MRDHSKVPLPKSARTLLKTPRTTNVIDMDSGQYCHYGVKSTIETFIVQLLLLSVDCISLLCNVDGDPLGKSSERELWIIVISEAVLKTVELLEFITEKTNHLIRMNF